MFNTAVITRVKRITSFFIVLILAAAFLLPVGTYAQTQNTETLKTGTKNSETQNPVTQNTETQDDETQDGEKIVRVGWYESSFNTLDKSGRRSGYAYEYQLKIAAYTGWDFEYVKGSWSDLLQMLKDGEIDLMSDVSYTEERAEEILYPTLPMGTEEYYIFTSPVNREINADDYTTLNGKKIGVNKDSIQEDYYLKWEKQQGIKAEVEEQTCSEEESLQMLEDGKLDAYITPDAFADPERLVPVCKIGYSDFYFAVAKARPDLLADLNMAMNKIQDENRYYNQQMSDKYIVRSGVNAFLTTDETKWLSSHGPVRVGYQDNYLAFCAEDKQKGELIGTLKDYLDYASDCLENAHVDFETTVYPTAAEAYEALGRGEIDCMFPANLSGYDGETMDFVMSPALMRTEVLAVVREEDKDSFFDRDHVIVAVNEGNTNYDSFLLDNFPKWRTVYYPTTSECLKAVSGGVADCVLISNFRYNNIARECEKYDLTTADTGVGLDYSFALKNGNTHLYSILSRITSLVPDSVINTSLSYYITEDAKISFADYIIDHLNMVMGVTLIVVLIILLLMMRSMRAERRAKKLIAATETDDLTGLYNRDFFLEYANRLYREKPDVHMDAIVVNIEQFHSVNALHGRAFGDLILRTLGTEIRAVAKEFSGIAGRFEADRFDIYCRQIKDYQAVYDRLQGKMDAISHNASIILRMGVMRWQPDVEPVQMFDHARTACSMARGHYKTHLIIFDEKVREREMFEHRLLNDLRRAIDGYEFEVHYQPKYDIQVNPPKLVSAEALIRWRHPELGMIPPSEFIPLFERSGRIGEVDKYVWSEAAKQVVRWRELHGVTIPVSVNLSRVDVFDPELEKTLDEILDYNGLEHDNFKLEVTETAYTENADQVIRVVENLRGKGYQVEMDDFGTGYSSLNMLSEMPIDVLKMDRAFVTNIEHEEKNKQLVALILDIARMLKVPVVAEGVETASQLQMLKELGCAVVQGYYFSRPLPASEFEEMFLRGEKHQEEEYSDDASENNLNNN